MKMEPTNLLVLVFVSRICVGIFFLPSALGKFTHWHSFVDEAINYEILPEQTIKALAPFLPLAELVVSLMLILAIALPIAACGAAILLICFIVALSINLRRGRNIGCGCYGIADTASISWGTVARNILLLMLAIITATQAPYAVMPTDLIRIWQIDLQSAMTWPVPITALISFCFAMIYLTAWSVDIFSRVSRLSLSQEGNK